MKTALERLTRINSYCKNGIRVSKIRVKEAKEQHGEHSDKHKQELRVLWIYESFYRDTLP
jgi:hypothetical protein